MTDLALIPPHDFQTESIYSRATYMFLPQFFRSSHYSWYVTKACKDAKWTILDNGAFEGVETSITKLMELAAAHGIHEIVLPDVMGDKERTLAKLDWVAKELPKCQWHRRQFMFVVQGKTFKELCECINLAVVHEFPFQTFGLPKHLLRTVEDNEPQTIRLRLAHYIWKMYGRRYDVHFLGGSPVWIGEAFHISDLHVRSMDTSMPYVYAAEGLNLESAAAQQIDRERQPEYFGLPYESIDADLLAHNINYMIGVVHG